MSTASIAALIATLVWLGWLVLTDWVSMYPLNDLESSSVVVRARRALATYPTGLLIVAGLLLDETWSLVVALLLAVGLVVGHVTYWWMPYLGVAVRPQVEIYRREFSRTVQAVPTQGHLVGVDVQHLVAGVLAVIVLGATVLALLVR
jgi:hypothetical protein